ncbi:SDR family NAD(P)-dependent oxidoreductase [Erwinia sp. 9145]|uniref:SDR family NAD(P)-dependent oxidoreductase n=1 Tax=Erwinia sp. 9145 TaxID=1500895 RepID=UPI001E4F3529|nr:SDR family NAD(P)-dependent oxidoreductase [Erwinia sp. 9145]
MVDITRWATDHAVDLRTVELDVQSETSIAAAITNIVNENGCLDVVVHNAGHMAFGPAEAFTPEQFAQLYDINVLGAQRVNRAALPVMRRQAQGLLVWVGSTSHRGGTPPLLAPYFAAKAAMDALAVSYAAELAPWGIETSIVVPGAFTGGTNHFLHAGEPADTARQGEYDTGPTAGLPDDVLKNLAACEPPDADPASVARAIVDVVDTPFGHRPFRVHIDPSDDGCAVVNAVADRIRAEFLRRIHMGDLLSPRQKGVVHHGK